MSVDLPQPFGPRMHTCSPAAISRFTSRSAAWSPRITVTFFSKRSGGGTGFLHLSGAFPLHAHLSREGGAAQGVQKGGRNARLRLKEKQSGVKPPHSQKKAPEESPNKKEVKTTSFSPPGVGGVLHAKPSVTQQACPARQ